MRRLLVLIVLLSVMVFVNTLKTGASDGGDPMTLAAIGFVVLAAFTVAEIGSALSLPRVTGYIVAGAVLGPSVANILSRTVVTEMGMFNTLALGLIATAAGLELDARQLAKLWRTLAGTIVVKIVLGMLLVGGALLAAEHVTGILGLAATGPRLALALVFGALSIGTSPAIAIAVVTELRAKGRLTDLVLAAAVLKDVVVVIVLAVSLTVAGQFTGAGADTRSGHVLVGLALEIGSSLLAGGLLGILLIVYLRYVRANMLLLVGAMILVTAELARAWHLELLLVFIAAGFVVRNLSRLEHELAEPVHRVSLPVFVIFFTIAGARIDFQLALGILPLAVALAVVRGGVYLAASHVGGALGAEDRQVRRAAWLGYLPQAGVTLGLVGVAAHELPDLASHIQALGMAVVAVNLLVGPISLRGALRSVGDAAGQRDSDADEPGESEPEATLDAFANEIRRAAQRIPSRAGRQLVQGAVLQLDARHEELVDLAIGGWQWDAQRRVALVVGAPGLEDAPEVLGTDGEASIEERGAILLALYRDLRERLRQLPVVLEIPYGDLAVRGRHGPWYQRWRWTGFRWWQRLSGREKRAVNVAMMARVAFEPAAVLRYRHVLVQWNRAELAVLAELQRHSLGQRSGEEVLAAVATLFDRLRAQAHYDLRSFALQATRRLVDALVAAGTPDGMRRAQQYSRVEPRIRATLVDIEQAANRWRVVLRAAGTTVDGLQRLGTLRRRLDEMLQERVLGPVVGALQAMQGVLSRVEARLDYGEAGDPPRDRLGQAFEDEVFSDLESHTARFRTEITTHVLANEIRDVVATLPERLEALDPIVALALDDPSATDVQPVTVQREAERTLLTELVPGLDDHLRAIAAQVVAILNRTHEAREITSYVLTREEADSTPDEVRSALDRARRLVLEQRETLEALAESTPADLEELSRSTLDELHRLVLDTGRDLLLQAGVAPVLSRARRFSARIVSWMQSWFEWFTQQLARFSDVVVSREIYSRYYKQRIDAARLGEFVGRWRRISDIPQAYAGLFSIEPLAGPRFFVAHRSELEAILDAERAWLDGGPSSVLLVGPHGSGRTSLINACKLRLAAPRLLRPEPLQWRRDIGIFRALGLALGVRHGAGALVQGLTASRTAVLLDDLEDWFVPDVSGLAEIERFLDLVVRTRDRVFWIASIDEETLAVMEEAAPVANSFGRIVRIQPSSAADLQNVIEARHRASGRQLVFARGPWSSLLDRIPALSDRNVYFRVLTRASSGNLARALSLWIHGAEVRGDGAVLPRLRRLLTAALPFAGRLVVQDQALLLLLLRFGPLRVDVLAEALGLSRSDVTRRVAFLESAGLIEATEADGPLRFPLRVKPLVEHGLGLMGGTS